MKENQLIRGKRKNVCLATRDFELGGLVQNLMVSILHNDLIQMSLIMAMLGEQ
jgi:hypothetical protein